MASTLRKNGQKKEHRSLWNPRTFNRLFISGSAVSLLFCPGVLLTAAAQRSPSPSLEDLSTLYKRGDDDTVTRGGPVCAISPQSARLESDNADRNLGPIYLWSDRPLLVWQAPETVPVSRVVVYQGEPNNRFWDQSLTGNVQQVLYQGAPLDPGQTYGVRLSYSLATAQGRTSVEERLSFTLMEAAQRRQIAQELQAIENRLRTSNASAEERAIARSRFFAENQLYYDGLQELYAIANPSPQVRTELQEIASYLCPPLVATGEGSGQ